jgi:hypothetical protein
MLGMQHSALRESYSLPAIGVSADLLPYPMHRTIAGAADWMMERTADGSSSKAKQLLLANASYQHTSPKEDETLLLLQRLQEVTQHALTLQAKLRADHIRSQQRIRYSASEVLTIGEAGLLAELKLANDLLRSQLAQRNQLIVDQQQQILILQERLKDTRGGGRDSSSVPSSAEESL